MALVHLQGVTKSFGDVCAVNDVSFSVGRGEVVGFLGPNGAGKTTTMRLITQGLEPDEGSVSVDGLDVREAGIEARRRIGYLPETNPLYGDMLVSEFLHYMGRLRRIPSDELGRRVDAAVQQTGIGEMYQRPIHTLSKGFKQRTGLAQAILAEPDVLILDEPTEGLDPNQRVEIRRLVTELGSERTVLLSTHVMQEVQATCSRLLIIHRGRLIADGKVDELLAGEGRGVRVRVEVEADPEEALGALRSMDSAAAVQPLGGEGTRPEFLVVGRSGRDPRPDVFAVARDRGWVLWELSREQESLETLFRDLTSEAT